MGFWLLSKQVFQFVVGFQDQLQERL
uniref:Uncharacterized protein n=1 Tax=Anguilla anguilla TaxID=7936 RepID=A0A0E9VIV4_ANGAN